MKLRTSYVLMLLSVLALSLSGCEEDRQSGATGRLNLKLSADGAVTDVTTRSGNEDIPDVKDFSMTMLQGDKVQASWDKLADYDEDTTFPVGTYTMKAFYGDMEKEGFASPYYEGSTDVVIQSGATTEVEATCKLANTKITIAYTDDFKSYFKTYSSKVKSELGSEVTFASTETRAAYVKPGRVSVKVTFTKATGGVGASTVDVATIETALPQHHYHLLMDVDAGKAMLSVIFDRVTEEKPITLDISDRALNIQAPYFTLTGFDKMSNEDNLWDGYPDVDKLSALMTSLGGFKHCILRAESSKLSSWPEQGFDLANLKGGELEQIINSGIKLTGFGENRGEMGIIDFTGVVSALQVSENNRNHKFYLRVTSTYGKESEQYALNITMPKLCELLAAEPVEMGAKQVVLPVKLLEGDPKDVKLFYKVYGSWEQIANPTYVSVSGKPGYYDFTAKVDMGVTAKEFKAVYQGVDSRIVTVAVKVPDYTINLTDGDIWSREAIITVTPDNPADLSNVMKAIAAYYRTGSSNWVKASWKKEGDKLTITNLTPNTSYSFRTTCNEGETYSSEVAGRTEEETQIPNNNFMQRWIPTTESNVSNGGRPSYWIKTGIFQGYAGWKDADLVNVTYDDPEGWSTTNQITVPRSPKVRNKWYMVPSIIELKNDENHAGIRIRSVAWNDEGEPVPDNTAKTLLGGNIPVAPADDAFKRSAGKISLGLSYEQGIAFSSRPTSVSLIYKYLVVKDSDGGTIDVQVKSNGEVIGEGKLTLSSTSWTSSITPAVVPIEYKVLNKKATSVHMILTSSTKYWSNDENNIQTNPDTSSFTSVGSEVRINEIKLNYNR